MTLHYPLSPSSSERWLHCPGSITWKISEGDEDGGIYAEEGKAAHELLASRLRDPEDQHRPRKCRGCGKWLDRNPAYEPICRRCSSLACDLDDEMWRHVDSVYGMIAELRKNNQILAEWVEITWVHPDYPNFGGTADYAVVLQDGNHIVLQVVDFKYGAGVPVSPVGNTQLLCYLLLIRSQLTTVPDIMLGTIAQPRTPGTFWDTYYFDEAIYQQFCLDVQAASSPSDLHVPGDWCRWCKKSADCPALHQLALQTAAIEFSQPDVNTVLKLLEMGPALKELIDRAPEMALQLLERGVELPGWKAVEAIGNRTWIESESKTLKKLARRKVGLKLSTTRKLKTPTQLAKDGFESEIADLIHRPSRGLTIVRETDRREAVTFQPQLFSVVEDEIPEFLQ